MLARVGDIVMNFEIKGRGQPLLLISGMGTDLSAWSLQVPSFALNFMTICLDNRGTGKSDAPDAPYSIEMMADDSAKLLGVIGAESANVVGIGMGGRIALEMAIRHPSIVRNLVLCSSTPKATPSEVQAFEALKATIAQRLGREALARKEIPWLLSNRYFKDERLADGMTRVRMAKTRGTPDYAFFRQIEAMLEHDCSARLASVKAPTMVVGGSNDLLVPIQFQSEMARAIPGATFLALEAAHMVAMEAPKEFNEGALVFLMEREAALTSSYGSSLPS